MGRFLTPTESEAYYSQKRRDRELKRQILNQPVAITNKYPYKSLDSSTHEIRLLKLGKPPTIDSQTNYSLFRLSLSVNDTLSPQEKCCYQALSYTWSDEFGNADLADVILIDGHEVKVTRNLAAALREIFRHNKKQFIWADAVCINQSDINERNHQVSKMRLVYEKAEKVTAWLGEEYQNSEKAFKFFRSLLKRGVKKTMSKSWIPWRDIEEIKWDVWAVIRLFSRDYWRRVWVLQELRFAKDVTFRAGSETIDWKKLHRVQRLLWNGSKIVMDVLQSTDVGHMGARLWQDGPNIVQVGHGLWLEGPSVVDIGRESQTSDSKKLGAMLVRHRRKDATDPRDKVFAILSLCDGPAKKSITVDYDMNTSSVLLEATYFALEQEQDLLIICENKDLDTIIKMGFTNNSSEDLSRSTEELNLPSWVPNFALPPTRQKTRVSEWCQHYSLPTGEAGINDSLPTEVNKKTRGLYVSAAGSTKPQISISRDNKILSTAAIRLGTITEVSQRNMPSFEPEDFGFNLAYKVLREWFLTFSKYGGTDLEGPGGFLDLLLLGGLYKIGIDAEYRKTWIKEVLMDIKIVVQNNLPAETEKRFLRLLDGIEVNEQLPHPRVHAARVNMFGATHRCKERSLAVLKTPEIQFAIGPECAEIGDVVVVLSGCAVPVVLRKRDKNNSTGWCVVGDAYVNGFMDGRAVEEVKPGGRLIETFDIF